jgi:glycosyltransferase involved in cell wall biosynthesis
VTSVRALARLVERRPGAKLVFVGRAPAAADERAEADRARALADELGLTGRSVFFLDAMVPYAERGAWLREADCAITTHLDHLETRFAFRTRILDFIWAGLPTVCTGGDELADLVERDGLGIAIAPGDAAAAAAALERLLDNGRDAHAERFARAAARLAWPAVSAPLVRYVTAATTPPRLGAGVVPARPGPPARGVATRALRAVQRAVSR